MTGQEILDVMTRGLVVVMYATAFVVGLLAIHKSEIWSRRRSGIAIMTASTGWLLFYLFVVETGPHDPTIEILWSRVANYICSASLIAMGANIINATKIEEEMQGRHIYLVLEDVA